MKTLQNYLLIIVVCLALTAFKPIDKKQAGPGNNNQTTGILNLNLKWAKALHAKKLTDAKDLYTADAVFYSPGGDIANGKKQLQTLFTNVMKTYDSSINFTSRSLQISGTMAFNSGDYTEILTNRATHTAAKIKGSYLVVYKLETDGQWRIAQHMWTLK